MPTMLVAPPPAAGRDDGSQGARRPRGASRCASQPLRAPRPCKHGSLRPRGTPAHRCAPHSLCATRAKFCAGQPRFGRADLLLRAARRRRAPHRLDLPPMYPSPRALHTCTHVTLRRPTASHASQESTRMLRDVHMRECAHVPLPRALRPRAIISTRACMWCYRCRHCRPQFPTALDQNARFGQDRDQELRAGPRKSEPSSSPARRAQAHASPARAVSSMPCIDTTVYGGISCKVACTVLCCS